MFGVELNIKVKDMATDQIYVITQSVIAVISVIGGGALIFINPDSEAVAFVGTIMGTVLGFYFRGAANAQYASQEASRVKP